MVMTSVACLDPQECQGALQFCPHYRAVLFCISHTRFSIRTLQAYKTKLFLIEITICRHITSANGRASWAKSAFIVCPICPFSSVSLCLSLSHHENKVSYVCSSGDTELENLEIHSNTAILIQYPFWFWTIWTPLLVSVEKTKGWSVQMRQTLWSHWLSLYCILLLSQGSRKCPTCSLPCLGNWQLKWF